MDGVEMANLNMTLPWAGYQSLLFFQAGLDGGASHTLTFDALGKGEVVLDYAVVMGSSDENWLYVNRLLYSLSCYCFQSLSKPGAGVCTGTDDIDKPTSPR